MPPKRRPATTASSSTPKSKPRSRLAKQNNITAAEENDIRSAFSLFSSTPKSKSKSKDPATIPITDVRRAMIALSLQPTSQEIKEFISILDPENEGFADYESFLAICALKIHSRERGTEEHEREVEEAWGLFVGVGVGVGVGAGGREGGRGMGEEKITLEMLKRVAGLLNEDVDEKVLRDMISEANGGAGVGRGVERGEFEGVMRRAGMWR